MGDMPDDFLHKRVLCLITGASRGIGKQLAIKLAEKVSDSSTFLLLARNKPALESTAREIRSKNNSLEVKSIYVDLGYFPDFKFAVLNSIQAALSTREYETALIVHNAGSLGTINKEVTKFEDADEIRHYFDVNFVSMVLLNNVFLAAVKDVKYKVVVNITSGAAITIFPGFGLYATGKATRNAFMRSLAAEMDSVRVLNYAPGCCKTDMLDEVARKSYTPKMREAIESGAFDAILTCDQTVTRLLNILEANKFLSGDYIGYFDE